MHCNTLKQDSDSIVRGDGESRVGKVRASTTSPHARAQGLYATVTVRDPPNHTSSLNVKFSNKFIWLVDFQGHNINKNTDVNCSLTQIFIFLSGSLEEVSWKEDKNFREWTIYTVIKSQHFQHWIFLSISDIIRKYTETILVNLWTIDEQFMSVVFVKFVLL